jgi:hypothetical protein
MDAAIAVTEFLILRRANQHAQIVREVIDARVDITSLSLRPPECRSRQQKMDRRLEHIH